MTKVTRLTMNIDVYDIFRNFFLGKASAMHKDDDTVNLLKLLEHTERVVSRRREIARDIKRVGIHFSLSIMDNELLEPN